MRLKLMLMLALLLTAGPLAAQTNWELRIREAGDLQDIHAAYAAGVFSQEQLQTYVDERFAQLERYCPSGFGSCDTPERERHSVELLQLYLVAYER